MTLFPTPRSEFQVIAGACTGVREFANVVRGGTHVNLGPLSTAGSTENHILA